MLTSIVNAFSKLLGRTPGEQLAALAPLAPVADDVRVVDGWLQGARVSHIEIDASWRYSWLQTPLHDPLAIVAHYTDTGPGTSVVMAKRRQTPWSVFAAAFRKQYPGKPVPQNSWHISIDTDGSIVQMAPLTVGCWHVGSSTAKPIPGVGWGNRTAIGIELVNNDAGKTFPAAQVNAACQVWRAIVREYGIPKENAMVTHQSIDPLRRSDPGQVWMTQHAPAVLAFAFA